MTDQELIQALTEEFASRIRELCADDKMDCDQLCAGNILTAKCIVFQVAERHAALQTENAEKDKEIAKLKYVNISQRRGLQQLRDELSLVEAERDAAIEDVPHDCEHCKYAEVNGACKLLPDGDQFSPDYTDGFDRDGNCDHWEWHSAQWEG